MASAPAGLPVELFQSFAFYSAVVLAKTLLMALLTSTRRFQKGVFANPEDAKAAKTTVVMNNEAVERVRRNHLNDLENILPFVLIGFLYLFTNPDKTAALWHFRIFASSRIVHTIAYQLAIPQPSRAIAFTVGLMVNFSMLYNCLFAFCKHA